MRHNCILSDFQLQLTAYLKAADECLVLRTNILPGRWARMTHEDSSCLNVEIK